jgi:hypothetical protein
MQPISDRQTSDSLTRAQLAIFNALGDQAKLSQDRRQRALALDDNAWLAWKAFMEDGPLPATPKLPDMLRRLAMSTYRLAAVANDDLLDDGYPAGVATR